MKDQHCADHGASSEAVELDLRAGNEVCAAAIHGLAESVQRGGPEEHIAEAVVAIACAAAERNPDACTTSSQQVYQDFSDPEVHLTGMAFLWLQTDTDTHWHNLLLSHQARSR